MRRRSRRGRTIAVGGVVGSRRVSGRVPSPMEVPNFTEGSWLEGNSITYYFAKLWIFGKVLPNPITGEDERMVER